MKSLDVGTFARVSRAEKGLCNLSFFATLNTLAQVRAVAHTDVCMRKALQLIWGDGAAIAQEPGAVYGI